MICRKFIRKLFVGLTVSCASIASTEQSDIVHGMVKQSIQPTISEFNAATQVLNVTLNESCTHPAAQAHFKKAALVFSQVEFLRLGVMNRDNRLERLFFWPDRKGIGQRQLRQLMSTEADAVSNLEQLQQKSVAVQGLPALERLLFNSTAPMSNNNCALIKVIAENIAQIAKELKTDWSAETGIADALLNPATNGPYRTDDEAIAALLTAADAILALVSDAKLKRMLSGLDRKGTILKSAPFYRSGLTLDNIEMNLNSVMRLFETIPAVKENSGYAQLLFEYKTALTMLSAAREALNPTLDDKTARDRLYATQLITINMRDLIKDSIAPALGVNTGFNASDGD